MNIGFSIKRVIFIFTAGIVNQGDTSFNTQNLAGALDNIPVDAVFAIFRQIFIKLFIHHIIHRLEYTIFYIMSSSILFFVLREITKINDIISIEAESSGVEKMNFLSNMTPFEYVVSETGKSFSKINVKRVLKEA